MDLKEQQFYPGFHELSNLRRVVVLSNENFIIIGKRYDTPVKKPMYCPRQGNSVSDRIRSQMPITNRSNVSSLNLTFSTAID